MARITDSHLGISGGKIETPIEEAG